jgi:hypothetical protein
MVTMSQKSSVPQTAKSVSQALMSDNLGPIDTKFFRLELVAIAQSDVISA